MKALLRATALIAASLAPLSSFAVDFVQDIRPILNKNCFKCHGGPRAKKDLQMDRVETLSEHIGPGKYIVPGDPEGSELVRRVSLPPSDTNRMPPPQKGQPLSQGEIRAIRAWIQEGASLAPQASASPAPDAPDRTALQTWTSVKGTTLKAYFVRVDGMNVILRSEDGQEKTFPLTVFSEGSRAQIQAMAAQ